MLKIFFEFHTRIPDLKYEIFFFVFLISSFVGLYKIIKMPKSLIENI